MNLYQRLKKWRRARQFQLFREFLGTYEDSERWGRGVHCLNCRSVNAVHAYFCSQCGESLQEIQQRISEPAQRWMPEIERHTDPLQGSQVVILGARQKAMSRTDTQQIPLVRLRKGK